MLLLNSKETTLPLSFLSSLYNTQYRKKPNALAFGFLRLWKTCLRLYNLFIIRSQSVHDFPPQTCYAVFAIEKPTVIPPFSLSFLFIRASRKNAGPILCPAFFVSSPSLPGLQFIHPSFAIRPRLSFWNMVFYSCNQETIHNTSFFSLFFSFLSLKTRKAGCQKHPAFLSSSVPCPGFTTCSSIVCNPSTIFSAGYGILFLQSGSKQWHLLFSLSFLSFKITTTKRSGRRMRPDLFVVGQVFQREETFWWMLTATSARGRHRKRAGAMLRRRF